MSEQVIKQAIADQKIRCPQCKQPINKYEKVAEAFSSIWDGAGDSVVEVSGSRVTLICTNADCSWRERTEYWRNYMEE